MSQDEEGVEFEGPDEGDVSGAEGEGADGADGGGESRRRRRRGRRRKSGRGASAAPAPREVAPAAPAPAPAQVAEEEPEDDEDGARKRRRRRGRGKGKAEGEGASAPRAQGQAEPRVSVDLGLSLVEALGLGAEPAQRAAAAGFHTVGDVLFHLPTSYSDRRRAATSGTAVPGQPAVVRARVVRRAVRWLRRSKRKLVVAELADGLGHFSAHWPAGKQALAPLAPGRSFYLSGVALEEQRQLVLAAPQIEAVEPQQPDLCYSAGVIPVYTGCDPVRPAELRGWVWSLLTRFKSRLPALGGAASGRELEDVLWDVHFPNSEADPAAVVQPTSPERQALIQAEFFLYGLALGLRREMTEVDAPGVLQIRHARVSRLLRDQEDPLTDEQRVAFEAIKRDLLGRRPMQHLLQSDYGTGAGVVARMVALLVIDNGQQVVLLCANDAHAERAFRALEKELTPYDVRLDVVTSQLRGRARERLVHRIRKGEVDLVVGSGAIFQEAVQFRRLGLMIIEETEPGGGIPRRQLQRRGLHPHILVQSSLPLPAALIYTQYGDLRVSRLTTPPARRGHHETYVYPATARSEAYSIFMETLGEKATGLIFYSPRQEVDVERQVAERLVAAGLPLEDIAGLSARLSPAERQARLDLLTQGKIRALLVPLSHDAESHVPGCAALMVEGAEGLPLLRLHQLRAGLLGLEGNSAALFVLSEGAEVADLARLRPLEEVRDGFVLADQDLLRLGIKVFLGHKRPWLPPFKVGDMVRDLRLLSESIVAARRWEDEHPGWHQSVEHRWLVSALKSRWNELLEPSAAPES